MKKTCDQQSIHSSNSQLSYRFNRITNTLRPLQDTANCLKFPLIFINVIFWLLGLAMCLVGVYSWIEKNTFHNIERLFSENTLFFDPAFVFVAAGCFVFIITLLGFIGSLRENQCFLLLYTSILTLIFIGQMFAIIYVIMDRQSINEYLSKKLVYTIKGYRDDDDLHDLVDWVQRDWLKCCGINNYKDWDINDYFSCSSTIKGNSEVCSVPDSCCKSNFSNNYVSKGCGFGILQHNADLSDINLAGCLSEAYKWIIQNSKHIAIISGVLFLIEFITIATSLLLRNNISDRKQWERLYLD